MHGSYNFVHRHEQDQNTIIVHTAISYFHRQFHAGKTYEENIPRLWVEEACVILYSQDQDLVLFPIH